MNAAQRRVHWIAWILLAIALAVGMTAAFMVRSPADSISSPRAFSEPRP